MRLKPILFFLVVGGMAAFLVFRQAQQGGGGMIRIGQIAPDFTIKDSAGKDVKLSDYKGKLIFLNFWASWCKPCEAEMPDLELMHKAYKDRGFQMMAVSTDANVADAQKFYDDRKFSLPWYSDPGRRIADKYHVNVYPETFIIDGKGHVLKHYPGPVNTRIMTMIEDLIKEQEAERPAQ